MLVLLISTLKCINFCFGHSLHSTCCLRIASLNCLINTWLFTKPTKTTTIPTTSHHYTIASGYASRPSDVIKMYEGKSCTDMPKRQLKFECSRIDFRKRALCLTSWKPLLGLDCKEVWDGVTRAWLCCLEVLSPRTRTRLGVLRLSTESVSPIQQ